MINILRKVEKVIPSYRMLKQFSHSIILIKIRYGLSLWGSLFPIPGMLQDKNNRTGNKQSLLKIECSLNHVARIMISFKGKYQDMPIETLYKKANISSFSQMIAEATLMDIWNIIKLKIPKFHANEFKESSGTYELRSGSKIVFEFDKYIVNSFFHRAALLWNLLPGNMKMIENRNRYKSEVKSWILQNVKLKLG